MIVPATSSQSDLLALACPKCGFAFKVHRRFAGRTGTCPNPVCAAPYKVPALRRQADAAPLAKQPGRSNRRRLRTFSWSLAAGLCLAVLAGAGLLRPPRGQLAADEAGGKPATVADNARPQRANSRKVSAAQLAGQRKRRRAAAMKRFHDQVQPFLKKYCFQCHGPREQMEGIAFHKWTDEKTVFGARKTWEKVRRVVQSRAMPPEEGKRKPIDRERALVATWIEDAILAVDCRLVDDPGRVTIRRLNRSEYNNTIRDLIGVDFKPAKDFPSDDVGYGFDNIGDVLSLPPLLMEKYLAAAEDIAERAVVIDDPSKKRQRVVADKMQTAGGAGGVFGSGWRAINSNGEVFSTFRFPRTGEYLLRAEAQADQAGDEPAKMEFRLNGKKLKVFEIKGRREPNDYEFKLKVKAGRHKFAAAFINDYYNPKGRRRRGRDRNLAVRFLEVRGPIGINLAKPTAVHKRLIFTHPGPKKPVRQAAREIVAKFLPRAFRRPVTDAEIAKYARLVELVVEKGDSFERGVQVALTGILVSPHFLFRIEQDRKPNDPQATRSLNQYELATRLSYFLWSSMPDRQLFDLAARGKLDRPAVLRQQVRRMIADPRSQALVKNFAAQWLNLRILDEVTPDGKQFPFNEKLRADMKRETELFFESVMREDRSILDFLDARFTFLNERLARHYGIAGVKGEKFRRVKLTGNHRAGVLTHASILTLTSNPTRTSPVKRGKWILENIFDQPPPDPPPNVPQLDEKKIAAGNVSLRKQLEIHRKSAVCASCHKVMDTLGFGFENFDAVGRWREKDGKQPVDASGEMPDGSKFRGPLELVRVLKKRKADFARCFSKKLLTFALGRGLEYYDQCTVDEISKAVAQNGYRFSSVVTAIVTSDAFLKRRGDGAKP